MKGVGKWICKKKRLIRRPFVLQRGQNGVAVENVVGRHFLGPYPRRIRGSLQRPMVSQPHLMHGCRQEGALPGDKMFP